MSQEGGGAATALRAGDPPRALTCPLSPAGAHPQGQQPAWRSTGSVTAEHCPSGQRRVPGPGPHPRAGPAPGCSLVTVAWPQLRPMASPQHPPRRLPSTERATGQGCRRGRALLGPQVLAQLWRPQSTEDPRTDHTACSARPSPGLPSGSCKSGPALCPEGPALESLAERTSLRPLGPQPLACRHQPAGL